MITVDALVEQLQKQIDDHQTTITKLTGSIEVLRSLKAQGFTQVNQEATKDVGREDKQNDQLATS